MDLPQKHGEVASRLLGINCLDHRSTLLNLAATCTRAQPLMSIVSRHPPAEGYSGSGTVRWELGIFLFMRHCHAQPAGRRWPGPDLTRLLSR
jgi:hypothetical protein